MESVVRYLTKELKLKVNQQKSAVDNPWSRKFLGFAFTMGTKQITVHWSRIKRFRDKIRGVTRKMRGNNITDSIRKSIMPITRGWANYFGIAKTLNVFDALDGWVRRKIRPQTLGEHCQIDKASVIEGEFAVTDCANCPRVCEKCGLEQMSGSTS